MLLPDIHFGKVSEKPLNWREDKFIDTASDDDEKLAETSADVVAMLGFDPVELFKSETSKREYSDEYLNAMLEKVKADLPDWLYKMLMKIARASAGGRARARRRKSDMGTELGGQAAKVLPEDSEAFSASGDIAKADEEKQMVFGWASVVEKGGKPVVDRQKDVMKEEDLEAMAYDYVLECRVGGVMHERDGGEPKQAGRLVESVVLTKAKQEALGIDLGQVGWWVGMKIDDAAVWKKCKDGVLKGFSIHGRGLRSKVS